MSKKEKLFEQFHPVSTNEWMDKITADLKGADFGKKLIWKNRGRIRCNAFLQGGRY